MLVGQLVLPLLLLAAVSLAENLSKFYPIGGTITLKLVRPSSESIGRILWKCNADIVADWTHGQFLSYGRFKQRTTVDNTTGLLEIRSGTTTDSGKYEVEVNDKVHDVIYQVMVIKSVPKPDVWIQPLKCSLHSIQCTLNCDGLIKGAEPVTFSWTAGNEAWNQSERRLNITKDTANLNTFTCRMENPVSYQVSDPKENPFFHKDELQTDVAAITLITISVILLMFIIGICYKYRHRIASFGRNHIPVSQNPS